MKTVFQSIGPALHGAPYPYSDTGDRMKHQHVIERLAEEIHRPVQEIAPLYEDILTQLQVNARIKDFLPILVSKNVKQLLKNH